jgi:hypothetical protein
VGETQKQPFQLSFNVCLKVDFKGSRVTSDGGLILVRELDERLGLEKLIGEHLSDSRQGLNKQFTLSDLLRQSVYSRLAGYEDLNDAERLAADPTFRLISSQRIWDRDAALTSTLHWFETELLTQEENLIGLMALNRETLGQAESFDGSDRVVLDMDSSESPVHGEQEGSAYNGHFESVCYHPLFLFIPTGRVSSSAMSRSQVVVRGNANGVLHPLLFQSLVNLRLGKGRVRSENNLLALHHLGDCLAETAHRSGRPSHKPVALTSLQQRLVKTGGRLVKHARYYWLLLAESHLTRCRFGTMLQRIWALPVPTG